jgi:hypothetical protein
MSASNHPKPELSQPAVKPCEPSEPLNPDINTTLTVAGISFSKPE